MNWWHMGLADLYTAMMILAVVNAVNHFRIRRLEKLLLNLRNINVVVELSK